MRRTVMKQALQPSEIASINADDFKGARSFEKKKNPQLVHHYLKICYFSK